MPDRDPGDLVLFVFVNCIDYLALDIVEDWKSVTSHK
jgi:hypothetical protein